MSVIRDLAMLEPLVDTVQDEAVISDKCAILVRAPRLVSARLIHSLPPAPSLPRSTWTLRR